MAMDVNDGFERRKGHWYIDKLEGFIKGSPFRQAGRWHTGGGA
jgi:hypothetical protein